MNEDKSWREKSQVLLYFSELLWGARRVFAAEECPSEATVAETFPANKLRNEKQSGLRGRRDLRQTFQTHGTKTKRQNYQEINNKNKKHQQQNDMKVKIL